MRLLSSLSPEQVGKARRISVIGATGSGKSTVSRVFAQWLRLPLIELDSLRNSTSSASDPMEAFCRSAGEALSEERWIVDGHYRCLRDQVLARAEFVIWLDLPLSMIAMRLLKRARNRTLVSVEPSSTFSPPRARAGWLHRGRRLVRTLQERSEYARLLSRPEYKLLTVVRVQSRNQEASLLRAIEEAAELCGSKNTSCKDLEAADVR
jgi:adenylate kinase family enzyme